MLTRRAPQPSRAQRVAQRARRMARMAASVQPRAAVMGGSTSGPAPKTAPYRDPALLEMACDRPCLLMIPAQCSHRTDTTVAAHSNFAEHGGKGKNRRADDCFSVWSCEACHIRWLDQPIGHGGPTKAQKEAAFMAAHARQVLAWRVIAMDPAEPERFRRAARRALEHLNATPIGDLP
jgi:hypothetical protein